MILFALFFIYYFTHMTYTLLYLLSFFTQYKKRMLSFFVSMLCLTPVLVYAQVTCDGNGVPCDMTQLYSTVKKTYATIVGLGLMIGFVRLIYIGLKGIEKADNAGALKEVKESAFNLVVYGALFAGAIPLFALLIKELGFATPFLDMFKRFSELPVLLTAYADTTSGLPQVVRIDNPIDIFMLFISVFVKWICYPVLLGYWAYSGFLFVFAQGNPQDIQKAKHHLWYTFVVTIVVMVAQAFLLLLRKSFFA